MLNYWWVTRPKRKLDSVPEILSTIAENALDQEWSGERNSHLEFEDALENAGLKREGDRRDHTGGGGRTYMAWIESLGLVFKQEGTGKIKLTLAGEAIMNGASPVSVLTEQVLKYQFPSAFSISRGVNVSERFKIRPFRYLLRLLSDSRIHYLTQDELAKIVITEAENESDACHEYVVARILAYREDGDKILPQNFAELYTSSKGAVDYGKPFDHLLDIANTIFNWIEYTQLARREDKKLFILDARAKDVQTILANTPPFIDRPHHHEFFQRKYGTDPKHLKDTRNLTGSFIVTSYLIKEQKIKADCAEPKAIQYYRQQGFNMIACRKKSDKKTEGSRISNTKKMKRFRRIICSSDCINTIRECQNLTYKKKPDGTIDYGHFDIDPHTFSAMWYGLDDYNVVTPKERKNHGKSGNINE